MKRRKFIQASSTATASIALSPIMKFMPEKDLKNWAGNLKYSTNKITYPQNVEEAQKLVKQSAKLKVLGSRHCFNRIADSKDQFFSLEKMNKVVSLDTQANKVTVEGGIKYGELAPVLHEKGYALHNLASLPHISVAGACITATHGSGVKNGNLSSAVSGMEFITADGEIQNLNREKDGEKFNAAVVSLGALGIITKVTLDIQPTFAIKQYVFENMPLAQMREHFQDIVASGYSVSLFTDWQSDFINEVWVKSLDNSGESLPDPFYESIAATKNLHPIAALSAEHCTEQMGISGPWYERLPHFKMGFTPSSGKELQAEYFVPQSNAVDAIMAVAKMKKEIGPHLFISEIRTIDADKLWLSPCYNEPSVAIHFTWKQDWPAVSKLLPKIEKELAAYNVKPHWGKLFTVTPQVLAQRYPKMQDFKKMIGEYDPKGKFRNEFLSTNLYNI